MVVEEQTYVAAWYPQMGGYCGKCWIALHTCASRPGHSFDDGFDVHVFHDGDFPFRDVEGGGRPPICLHHCSPQQFAKFGELVATLQTPTMGNRT